MKEGYERRMKITRELNMESWRQARMVAYIIAQPNLIDKHMSIFDFYPLDGDPTYEERMEMKKREHDRLIENAQLVHDRWKRLKYGGNAKLN